MYSRQGQYTMKKALRETQTLRALAVVRCGHRPPAVTNHRQDRLQYIAPLLASAQYNQFVYEIIKYLALPSPKMHRQSQNKKRYHLNVTKLSKVIFRGWLVAHLLWSICAPNLNCKLHRGGGAEFAGPSKIFNSWKMQDLENDGPSA